MTFERGVCDLLENINQQPPITVPIYLQTKYIIWYYCLIVQCLYLIWTLQGSITELKHYNNDHNIYCFFKLILHISIVANNIVNALLKLTAIWPCLSDSNVLLIYPNFLSSFSAGQPSSLIQVIMYHTMQLWL